MIVISHRGFWLDPSEKNTETAFRRSFQLGFGTETDIRDAGGELVISHDMATGGEMSFAGFMDILSDYPAPLPIALNIKSDGLQRKLSAAIQGAGVERFFLFDMSVPDALVSLRDGLPCFTRHSDEEPDPCFYDRAAGVWLDAFRTDWWDLDVIRAHLGAGKTVAVVSPELHGRDPRAVWKRLLTAPDLVSCDRVLVCTDLPTDLQEELSRAR